MAALAVHDECASHATIAATFAGAIMAIISCGGSGRARLPCCGEDRGRARKDGECNGTVARMMAKRVAKRVARRVRKEGAKGEDGEEGEKGGREDSRNCARNKRMNDFTTNHC